MRRHPRNPILTRADIPAVPPRVVDPSSVFNPGAVAWDDGVALLLRVQTRGRETLWMTADSADGVRFDVRPHVVEVDGLDDVGETVHHAYDARLTRVGDEVYAVFAADTDRGCRLGVAVTTDMDRFRLVSFDSEGDRRNGVLFPGRVRGRWLRLERPNGPAEAGSPTTGDAIRLAESDDLATWRTVGEVMRGRWRSWDERIGSGPPPVRTADGWLHLYHGVATHFAASNVWQVGVVLLDAEDPTRVLARARRNVLEPREPYELVGQVANVVFPTGWVVDGVVGDEVARPDAQVRVYYGATDSAVACAETTIGELLSACRED